MCHRIPGVVDMDMDTASVHNECEPPGTKGGGATAPTLPSIVDATTLQILKDPNALKVLDCPTVKKTSSTPKTGKNHASGNPDIQTIAAAVAAAKLGVTDQLVTAMDSCETVVNARDSDARTCLHYAAGYGHEECVEALLARKADPKARDNNGDVPLHFAAIHGHPMCAYNIAKTCPASCLLKNARGQTPVDVSVACERGEVLNAMLLACAGDASDVAVKAMQKLLLDGAVPDTWAPNGSSALMLSAAVNGTEALKVLLENGATIELQDALGRSALMFAAGNCAEETLKLLLDSGACLAQRDRRGRSVLEYAPEGSNVRTILEERLKQLEAVANKAEQDLLASLETEGRRASSGSSKGNKKRKKAKSGKPAKLPLKPKITSPEQNSADGVLGSEAEDEGEQSSCLPNVNQVCSKPSSAGVATSTARADVQQVPCDSWQVVSTRPQRKVACKLSETKTEPVPSRQKATGSAVNSFVSSTSSPSTTTSVIKGSAYHRRCGSAHSITSSTSSEVEAPKCCKGYAEAAADLLEPVTKLMFVQPPTVSCFAKAASKPAAVSSKQLPPFKAALLGAEPLVVDAELDNFVPTKGYGSWADKVAQSQGSKATLLKTLKLNAGEGCAFDRSCLTLDSAASLVDIQADKCEHSSKDCVTVNCSLSTCTDSSHCTVHTDAEFDALNAELTQMKLENEKLLKASKAKELYHQQELAAVLEDAAQHELEAVNKAVYQERLRLVSQLMQLGLSPDLLIHLLSLTSIVHPLSVVDSMTHGLPHIASESSLRLPKVLSSLGATPIGGGWDIPALSLSSSGVCGDSARSEPEVADSLDLEDDLVDLTSMHDIPTSLGLDPLPTPLSRTTAPAAIPTPSAGSFGDKSGMHFSLFDEGLGLREEFMGGRCAFVAPAQARGLLLEPIETVVTGFDLPESL